VPQVEANPSTPTPTISVVIPADEAVRYIEELRVAVLAAEVDAVALEPHYRDRILRSDLHLANGIHRGSDHHAASMCPRSRSSAGDLSGSCQ
jgi:hypothetical protein